MSLPASFDPDDPLGLDEPDRLYAPLRRTGTLARSERYGGFWAATRYRDVQRILSDPARFTSRRGIIIPRNPASGVRPPLHYDPPEHTAVRRAINPVFRKDRLARLTPIIRKLAAALLPTPGGTAELDFYGEFCSPYSAAVVCALLNIPEPLVPELTRRIERFEDAQRRRDVAIIEEENLALYELCRTIVAARAADPLPPAEDMVSALLADDAGLDAEAVAGSLRQILVAGHGAPALALASAVLHLARAPALAAHLRADPSSIPAVVDELLRLHTPNVGFARTATADVVLGGVTVRAGEPVAVVLPAANRDPEIFEAPDEVRPGRPERHLAFGVGPHVCPGSVTGREEIAVALTALLERSERLELAGEVVFSPWPTAGPIRLPLRIETGSQS